MGYLTYNRRRALTLSGISLYLSGYVKRGLGLIVKMLFSEYLSIKRNYGPK